MHKNESMTYYFYILRHLIKAISLKRTINAARLLAGYYLSRIVRKPVHWGYPLNISFEPTNICNLGCPECPTGLKLLKRNQGKLKLENFKKVIDEVYAFTPALLLYFQGEPFLNPDLVKMIEYARSRKMFVSLSSNGHFLNEKTCREIVRSGLSKIIISMDGTTQEVYEKYRQGGHLHIVLKGIDTLVKIKKEMNSPYPLIELQFLVFRFNEHQLDEIKQLAREKRVDHLALKTAQVYDYQFAFDKIPQNKKYSRYVLKNDHQFHLRKKAYNHCWKMWHSPVITWDGAMVPCCFDKDASYPAGNVFEKGFKNVWQNKTMNDFRFRVLTRRKEIDICQNCTEGLSFWI